MNNKILPKVKTPEDLKNLAHDELTELSSEIRKRIIAVVSKNGGHLASNLGTVELSIALHYVFSSPIDKFIFDTSHQTYTHKIITSRNKDFSTLRNFKGISGFAEPNESNHDSFVIGHSGTALSLALGLAKTRSNEEHIITILGDGSLTCGLTFEALNNLEDNLKNFIIILNDNKMAISKNVGNIKNILSRIINSPTISRICYDLKQIISKLPGYGQALVSQAHKIAGSLRNLVSPSLFFEQFGLSYVGPIDGHNIKNLISIFSTLKNFKRPVLVHILTQKGKGFLKAQQNPTPYHGVEGINKDPKKTTFPSLFGEKILKMAKKDPNLVAITPAMIEGSHLTEFKNRYPERCFDVGIAEGHALTFGGALAKKKQVVVCIYSSFLQRAFDNLFHDICLQDSAPLIAIDRSGLNSRDGVTHHGIYDIGFLNAMPNIVITQPRNGQVLSELMTSANIWKRPFVIRYPNLETEDDKLPLKKRDCASLEILSKGKDLLIITIGHTYKTAFQVEEKLKEIDIFPTIVDPVFLKPLDSYSFCKLLSSHRFIVTIEEHAIACGFASIFNSFLIKNNLKAQVLNLGISDRYLQHGEREQLLKEEGLDFMSIYEKILKHFGIKKLTTKRHDRSSILL